MPQHRFAWRSGWLVLLICTGALASWMLFEPVLRSLRPSSLFVIYPTPAMLLGAAAFGIVAFAGNWPRVLGFGCAIVVLGASAGFLAGVPGASNDLDFVRLWHAAPQTALSMLLIGAAMIAANIRRSSRFDLGDAVGAAAILVPFVMLLGYLFDATQLYSSDAMPGNLVSPLSVLLQLLLALGTLDLRAGHGLIAAFTARTGGATVGRKLLPWIVLLPILFGWMQIACVRSGLLDLPLALALTVSATIAALMGLIHWASTLMSMFEVRQTERHAQREHRAKEEGMTDALTGLLNRRGWEHNLKIEEQRCVDSGRNGCVIMIDLDDLKKVNDTQGHTQGDELIKRAALALRKVASSGDVLARLGGDEFACLIVGCQPEHADLIMRRLAEAMAKQRVGASMGYAMRDINVNLQGAFDEADRLMYANKRARKARRAAS